MTAVLPKRRIKHLRGGWGLWQPLFLRRNLSWETKYTAGTETMELQVLYENSVVHREDDLAVIFVVVPARKLAKRELAPNALMRTLDPRLLQSRSALLFSLTLLILLQVDDKSGYR